jgi:hypothetical protein
MFEQPRPLLFAALLTRDRADSTGRVAFEPNSDANGAAVDETPPPLATFVDALAERTPLSWQGAGGRWSLQWQ